MNMLYYLFICRRFYSISNYSKSFLKKLFFTKLFLLEMSESQKLVENNKKYWIMTKETFLFVVSFLLVLYIYLYLK